MYKPDLEKAEEPEIKLPAFFWIMEKLEFQKNIYFYFINHTKAFDYVDHNKLWKAPKEMGIPDHLTCLWETCMQVKKQQLELVMEQLTGYKLEKVYKTVLLPVRLLYMQSTSCEMPGWIKHKLESRFPGEIPTISDMQMIPLYERSSKNIF